MSFIGSESRLLDGVKLTRWTVSEEDDDLRSPSLPRSQTVANHTHYQVFVVLLLVVLVTYITFQTVSLQEYLTEVELMGVLTPLVNQKSTKREEKTAWNIPHIIPDEPSIRHMTSAKRTIHTCAL